MYMQACIFGFVCICIQASTPLSSPPQRGAEAGAQAVTGINCICKPVLLPFIPYLTPSAALECRLALMHQHRGSLLLLS